MFAREQILRTQARWQPPEIGYLRAEINGIAAKPPRRSHWPRTLWMRQAGCAAAQPEWMGDQAACAVVTVSTRWG